MTKYRNEEETRYNTIYEVEYVPTTTIQTREVPVITYETAFRDEETITYTTEYETRTRDVPVERQIIGEHSNDSGDGVESEPELVVSAAELAARQAAADAANAAAASSLGLGGNVVLLDGGRGLGGLGNGYYHGWAQTGGYHHYATADSSDDRHVYTVTEY